MFSPAPTCIYIECAGAKEREREEQHSLKMAAASGCLSNCTRPGFFEHEWTAEELWAPWEVLANYLEYQPWFFSLLGSAMVGLSGVFPLLVIPIDEAADLKHGGKRGAICWRSIARF